MKTELVVSYDKLKQALDRTKNEAHVEFKDHAFYSEALVNLVLMNVRHQIIDDVYHGTSVSDAIEAGARSVSIKETA